MTLTWETTTAAARDCEVQPDDAAAAQARTHWQSTTADCGQPAPAAPTRAACSSSPPPHKGARQRARSWSSTADRRQLRMRARGPGAAFRARAASLLATVVVGVAFACCALATSSVFRSHGEPGVV